MSFSMPAQSPATAYWYSVMQWLRGLARQVAGPAAAAAPAATPPDDPYPGPGDYRGKAPCVTLS